MGRTTVRHVCSFRFSNRELWHSLDSSKMLSCYSVLFGINCFGYKYDSGACASCCWRWWWRWRVRAPFKRINSKRWTRNNAAREKKNASINSVQATRNRNCDSHITFFCCTIIHWCDNCYSSSFCVCALCSVLSGLRQPVLRIFVVHYRRRCAIFVCLHIFCSQSVWIVSLRLLNLYHVQTFLACSTLSRSMEAKQTFWPVCAWSTVVVVVAISPLQQLQLNVVTETERYVSCHVRVCVCVCAIINFHFQLLNPFQRCTMSKNAVHVLDTHTFLTPSTPKWFVSCDKVEMWSWDWKMRPTKLQIQIPIFMLPVIWAMIQHKKKKR